MIQLSLTDTQYRRLLDMVYIGNWILNSAREDRIKDYDNIESLIFAQCFQTQGMDSLIALSHGRIVPSDAFANGGIQEAIRDYEDSVFYDILAEELTARDIGETFNDGNMPEVTRRIEAYLDEFDRNGIDNLFLDK